MPFISGKDEDDAAAGDCATAVALLRTNTVVGANGPASERAAKGSASGERVGAGLEEEAVREEIAWIDAT